jgi:L,D-peptidoglycan transpeptidase YkuD (ErfK/YbiS/YcfS/YnhG family)
MPPPALHVACGRQEVSRAADFVVTADGWITWPEGHARCALGRSGVAREADKREGDGATPLGSFLLRSVLYRPDRGDSPQTLLPVRALTPQDGWCEDPADPDYNRLVKLPHPGAIDRLWREDHLYDVIVVIGHNDEPVCAGMGSAIFLHLARADFSPTAGCVAVSRQDMERILVAAGPESRIIISRASASPSAGVPSKTPV